MCYAEEHSYHTLIFIQSTKADILEIKNKCEEHVLVSNVYPTKHTEQS